MKKLILLALVAMTVATLQAAPKKILVVTTTTGFRHSSIPESEKILTQLAKDSGEFTVDFVQQPPGQALTGFPAKLDPGAQAAWDQKLKAELQKLSPESLKNYDAVMFVSTTGNLPIPDQQGLLDWIKTGHAFIGIHAATDTFHGWPEFVEMLGGEFAHHGPQVGVDCLNQDPSNPATAHLPKAWTISQEEIYQFKNYNATNVHDLLILDKHPETGAAGHFGVSWCKDYGAGKVFYTSLGHREDIWDADPKMKDRKNSVEIAKAYQQHVLGGIEWALGLKTSVPVHPQ
jgi:type 1 glutamine amidotransferase